MWSVICSAATRTRGLKLLGRIDWRPISPPTRTGYIFRFDVPGVPKDSIAISVEDSVLTVSAERSETFGDDESKTIYRREVLSGKHERSFRLPEDAAADKVNASYADGVLEVRIARAEAAQPRRIPITVS